MLKSVTRITLTTVRTAGRVGPSLTPALTLPEHAMLYGENSHKSKGWTRAFRGNQKGFSLIEILVVITLMVIVIAIAVNIDYAKPNQLTAATRQLYADLNLVKQNAIMQNVTTAGVNSRGFGIRFASNVSYTTFTFNDANSDYSYNGTGEEYDGKQTNLPSSVTATIGDAGAPADNVLIFDKRGIGRGIGWGTVTNQAYVLRLAGVSQAKCVQVDGVTIREGNWNGASCN